MELLVPIILGIIIFIFIGALIQLSKKPTRQKAFDHLNEKVETESEEIINIVNRIQPDAEVKKMLLNFDHRYGLKNIQKLETLKEILLKRGYDVKNVKDIQALIMQERENEEFDKFKRVILTSEPASLEEYIDSFMSSYGENYSEKMLLFKKLIESVDIPFNKPMIDKLIKEFQKKEERDRLERKLLSDSVNINQLDYDDVETTEPYDIEKEIEELIEEINYPLQMIEAVKRSKLGKEIRKKYIEYGKNQNPENEMVYLRLLMKGCNETARRNGHELEKIPGYMEYVELCLEADEEGLFKNAEVPLYMFYKGESPCPIECPDCILHVTDDIDEEGNLISYEDDIDKTKLDFKSTNSNHTRETQQNKCMRVIDKMSGFKFQDFVEKLFKEMGYKTSKTKLSGDQGGDLIAERAGMKFVIQAKRYSGKVNNKAVQEVVAAIKHYNADEGIVVTSSYYTKSAKQLAHSNNIRLIDRNELREIVDKYL